MRRAYIESALGISGCSLIEVLVAMAIFIVVAAGLGQLATLAAGANLRAGRTSLATVIAQQKIEELLSDPGLAHNLSPPRALTSSLDGWFDFVDRRGRPIGPGATPATGSDYLRRWSVEALTDSATLVVQVEVSDIRNATSAAAVPAVRRIDHVRLVAATGAQAF
jgi:type II secretory pathway pseudopilin PulG